MNELALIFGIVGTISGVLAVFYSRQQTRQAQQIAASEAVMHFTDRFFELLKQSNGDLAKAVVTDDSWAYLFWSLQATEFYFFHHRLLPKFMYTLWMKDLASLYQGEDGEQIREKHVQYLNTYSQDYEAMCEFYKGIYRLAENHSQTGARNEALSEWIDNWYATHKPDDLSRATSLAND